MTHFILLFPINVHNGFVIKDDLCKFIITWMAIQASV